MARVTRTWRGEALLAILCAMPVVIWVFTGPVEGSFDGWSAALTTAGVLAALTGVAAFALNLVLGGRIPVVARQFEGLDRMYRAHRITGRAALWLLLLHAAMIIAAGAVDLGWDALTLLTPTAGTTVFLGVIALGLMTVSIVLTLYAHLNHEVFVYVQRSFGFIFVLGALHAFRTDGFKAESGFLTFYLAVLAVAGILAFLYRSLLHTSLVPRRDFRVVSVRHLDTEVVEITMEPLGRPLDFVPGQFVFVTFASAAMARELPAFSTQTSGESEIVTFRPGAIRTQFHPFSITSAPGERVLKVVVKASGDYTDALRVLEVGAGARVEGPYGVFSHTRARAQDQVWIAGGVGVTPFLSMARSLDAASPYKIDFFYCTKTAGEAHYLAELRALEPSLPGLTVHACPEDTWGFVTADRVRELSGEVTGKDVFLCGPPAMIRALTGQFGAAGVPRHQIHFEEFGFAGKKRLGPGIGRVLGARRGA